MLSLLDFLNEKPAPEPMAWNYISPSRLNLWLKCPLAFRRRYVDGLESPSSPSLFVGKAVHDTLDSIYRCVMLGAYTTERDVPAFVDDSWQRLMDSEACTFDDADHETKCRSQVVDLVNVYLAETDITAEKPLAVERKFESPLIDPLTATRRPPENAKSPVDMFPAFG